MRMREAGPSDRAALEALLLAHVAAAMFPLSNLRDHGLATGGGFASSHPNAMRAWLLADGTGMVALTQGGMLMPVLPRHADLHGASRAVGSLPVTGAIGPADQVRALLEALGLDKKPTRLDCDEPGFALDLDRLEVPSAPDTALILASADQRDLLLAWRTAYHVEILGTPEPEATRKATADIDGHISRRSHRILIDGGVPVAVTGFNAVLPEIVQIGGVYTPPGLRGRGFARRALALHLQEARATGVRRAVLFAASEAAARAYTGIGFQPSQPMALILFDGPQKVAA